MLKSLIHGAALPELLIEGHNPYARQKLNTDQINRRFHIGVEMPVLFKHRHTRTQSGLGPAEDRACRQGRVEITALRCRQQLDTQDLGQLTAYLGLAYARRA